MNKNFIRLIQILIAVGLIVSGISAYIFSDKPLIWQVSGAASLLLTIYYLVMERRFYKEVFSKQTTWYGLTSIFMAVVVIAITVFINLIASEYNVKKDLTKNQIHSLSEQSIKVVKGLTEQVKMMAFISPMQRLEFDSIFDKYSYHSKMIQKEYVDPEKQPTFAEEYKVKQLGVIIIENASKTRSARVENLSGAQDPKLEEKITNAIISVAKGDKKKIYFTSGHGEKLISDTSQEGYSQTKELLEGGRYNVEQLVLLEKGFVPEDAAIVVIPGPKSDFMEMELKALEEYTKKGGKIFLMMEPTTSGTLKPFLTKYGVNWNPGKTVFEANRLQQMARGNPLTPLVATYDSHHEITRDARQLSIYPIATPVEKSTTTPPEYVVTSNLLSTTSASFEVELKANKVNVNEKKDRKGPLSLAVAVTTHEAPKKEETGEKNEIVPKTQGMRLLVIGDSDFAANNVRGFGINSDLFQNMLSWLAEEEDLIAIRPKELGKSQFDITEQRAKIINLSSIFILPLIMMFSGLFMFLSRRKR